MLDSLHRITHVEQLDPLLSTVGGKVRRLPCGGGDVDRTRRDRHRARGDDVIDHAHLLVWAPHPQSTLRQSCKSLWAGVFVHDVQVDI